MAVMELSPPLNAAKADGEVILPPDGPRFVSEIIERGLGPHARRGLSFIGIFEPLNEYGFRIVAGVDSDGVSAFVSRIESAAHFDESEQSFCHNVII
jgi:hypothetical protein